MSDRGQTHPWKLSCEFGRLRRIAFMIDDDDRRPGRDQAVNRLEARVDLAVAPKVDDQNRNQSNYPFVGRCLRTQHP